MTRRAELASARVFQPLLAPARYKGAWGGRGSGKSHFFAEMLVEESLSNKGLLSVCIREVQKSLADSAKRLIEAKLLQHDLGAGEGFKVYRDKIETPGDGVIAFQGMQAYVTPEADARCAVPAGFVRLYDEAASGLSSPPDPTAQPDDAASGIALSAVAAATAENFGLCHEIRGQLMGLQDWERMVGQGEGRDQ